MTVLEYFKSLGLYHPESETEEMALTSLIESHRWQRKFVNDAFEREMKVYRRFSILPRWFVSWLLGY